MNNEFIYFDRIEKIKQIINQYGENNFYIAFSGGKDSCVMSHLIDEAIPGNTIPRVYADTGIELNMIRDFVYNLQKEDSRIEIIKPELSIKETLEKYGYPFKSKRHSFSVAIWQKYKTFDGRPGLQHYLHISDDGVNWASQNSCPNKLRYQFTNDFNIKVSDKCCAMLKEKPLIKWQKEHKRKISIIGLMRAEEGRRKDTVCLLIRHGYVKSFHPLAPITKEWEEWYINEHNVKICDIYKPPYNFIRTGCKGCPFAQNIQEELDTLEKFFPSEKKQCEYIWKPIYEEYRRINYRLKGDKNNA